MIEIISDVHKPSDQADISAFSFWDACIWDYSQRNQLTSITLNRLGGSCWFVGHLGHLH
jgi:hypothetical protein